MRIAWITSAIFFLSALGYGTPGRAATQTQVPAPSYLGQTAQQSAPAHTTPVPFEGSSPQTNPAAGDIEALRGLEANYLRAEMEDNATLAESILADDYVGVKADGGTAGKQEVLNNLAMQPRSREPYSITASNMREHLFGDTACVTYTKTYKLPNSRAAYSENLLHIFTKRNGRWRLQVSSLMPAPGPQMPARPRANP